MVFIISNSRAGFLDSDFATLNMVSLPLCQAASAEGVLSCKSAQSTGQGISPEVSESPWEDWPGAGTSHQGLERGGGRK